MSSGYNYQVSRKREYTDIFLPDIYRVEFERDFVKFYDILALKTAIPNDTITRLERVPKER